MSSDGVDYKIKLEMLMEIVFEERKNNHANESDKKSDNDMVAMVKRIVEKGVKRDEVQKNGTN